MPAARQAASGESGKLQTICRYRELITEHPRANTLYCCIINVECGDLGGHGPSLSPHSLLGWGTGPWALLPSAPRGEGWSLALARVAFIIFSLFSTPWRMFQAERPGSCGRCSSAGAVGLGAPEPAVRPRRQWALEEAPGVGGGLGAAGGLPPPRRTSLRLLLAVSGRLLYNMQLLFRMRPGFGSGRGSQTPLLGPCPEWHPGRAAAAQIEAVAEASERSHWKMHCRGRRRVRLAWSRDEVLARGARSLPPRPR